MFCFDYEVAREMFCLANVAEGNADSDVAVDAMLEDTERCPSPPAIQSNLNVERVRYASEDTKRVMRDLRFNMRYPNLPKSRLHYKGSLRALGQALRWLRKVKLDLESRDAHLEQLHEDLAASRAMTRLWRDKYTARADECEQRRQFDGKTEDELDVMLVAMAIEAGEPSDADQDNETVEEKVRFDAWLEGE